MHVNDFFHCGTNCLEDSSFSVNKVYDNFINMFTLIQNEFPYSELVISSLLPRLEEEYIDLIPCLNDFLYGCCVANEKMKLMNNTNISKGMLYDEKHIDYGGFRTMMSNIRFAVFGKSPRFNV